MKRVSASAESAYWPPAKRQAVETRDQSYGYSAYGTSRWLIILSSL